MCAMSCWILIVYRVQVISSSGLHSLMCMWHRGMVCGGGISSISHLFLVEVYV